MKGQPASQPACPCLASALFFTISIIRSDQRVGKGLPISESTVVAIMIMTVLIAKALCYGLHRDRRESEKGRGRERER